MKKLYVVLILVVVGVGALLVFNTKLFKVENGGTNPIACTEEAKICPDGSAVGRTGPNCEFAECPAMPQEKTVAFLNERIFNGGIFITPLEVVSDSRCPIDVNCVWAGEIIVKVKLEKGIINREEVDLKEGGSAMFEGSNISLVSVFPAKNSKVETPIKNYQFTFKVISEVNQGTVSGTVTLSPTCPVERIPPDPNCAPKPYSTPIDIMKSGSTVILKTIHSDEKGMFGVELNSGSYVLQARGGNVLPRCGEISVEVKSGQNINTEISCDTGIR